MSPFGGDQNREIVLLESVLQLGHGVGTRIRSFRRLGRLDRILEFGANLFSPAHLLFFQKIDKLTGRPLPHAQGGIREISVPAMRTGALIDLPLLTLDPEHQIVGLRRIGHDRVSDFFQASAHDLSQGCRVHRAAVGDDDRLHQHALRFLQQLLLLGCEEFFSGGTLSDDQADKQEYRETDYGFHPGLQHGMLMIRASPYTNVPKSQSRRQGAS